MDGNKKEIISLWKILMFILFSFSIGLMISPSIYLVNHTNPVIFPVSIGISSFIFGFVQFLTFMQKDLDGLKYYVPLTLKKIGLMRYFTDLLKMVLKVIQ